MKSTFALLSMLLVMPSLAGTTIDLIDKPNYPIFFCKIESNNTGVAIEIKHFCLRLEEAHRVVFMGPPIAMREISDAMTAPKGREPLRYAGSYICYGGEPPECRLVEWRNGYGYDVRFHPGTTHNIGINEALEQLNSHVGS